MPTLLSHILLKIGQGMQYACLVLLLSSSNLYSYDTKIESAYRVIFSDDLGYTLIGLKPISYDYLSDSYLRGHPETFKRVIDSLKATFQASDTFVLKVFDCGSSYDIELIHRKALRDIVSKSRVLRKFGKKFFSSEEAFLAKIEDKDTRIFEFGSEICGILFGYGEENTEYFCRWSDLNDYFASATIFTRCLGSYFNIRQYVLEQLWRKRAFLPYMIKKPQLSAGFDSLKAEYAWLQSIDETNVEANAALPPCFISLPVYRCKRGPGSDALRAMFIQGRDQLAKILSSTSSYKQAVENQVRALP